MKRPTIDDEIEQLTNGVQHIIGRTRRSYWVGTSTWIPEKNNSKKKTTTTTAATSAVDGTTELGDNNDDDRELVLYTPEELYNIFRNECLLLVGDSLQRRAADTMYLMMEHIIQGRNTNNHYHQDIPTTIFTDAYFNNKTKDRGFQQRRYSYSDMLSSALRDDNTTTTIVESNTYNQKVGSDSSVGCVDTDWRPLLEDVDHWIDEFATTTNNNYSVIVLSSTIWDVAGNSTRHPDIDTLQRLINNSIHHLHDRLLVPSSSSFTDSSVNTNTTTGTPMSTRIIWKSSGWAWFGNNAGRKNLAYNFKIAECNYQAEQTIKQLNHPQLLYLDWGKEILPRSFGDDQRVKSNDGNPYHYGFEPRWVFWQMLANELVNIQQLQHMDHTPISDCHHPYDTTRFFVKANEWQQIWARTNIFFWISITSLVIMARTGQRRRKRQNTTSL
jgi:hypothetical protein